MDTEEKKKCVVSSEAFARCERVTTSPNFSPVFLLGRSVGCFFSRSHGTCDFIIRSGEDGLLVGCELNREKNMKTMKG